MVGTARSVTKYPGFGDRVHDAQRTFRSLLHALSHPGERDRIEVALTPPPGLHPATAATCLTLFDLDTTIWVQPGRSDEIRAWLAFHAGCRFSDRAGDADFALVLDVAAMPPLTSFRRGTAELPETGATIAIQLDSLEGDRQLDLTGPGILEARSLHFPHMQEGFWRQWQTNTEAYPCGVDAIWLSGDRVMGLPRTTRVREVS
ncbi:MAG: phosphonate C-P lyase system protein PhnH [Cyanobacteria bacterium J06639_1]